MHYGLESDTVPSPKSADCVVKVSWFDWRRNVRSNAESVVNHSFRVDAVGESMLRIRLSKGLLQH